MIRVTVDSQEEFERVENAMELPTLEEFEFQLSYSDPSKVPSGRTIGAGRIRTKVALPEIIIDNALEEFDRGGSTRTARASE